MKQLKRLIKKLFNFFNLNIQFVHNDRSSNEVQDEKMFADKKWLLQYGFKTIVDIGANEGQFAKRMRALFPDTRIISFEPIDFVYDKLVNNFEDDNNFIAYNVGLGEKEETMKLWLNEYSPSSSLLKMTTHLDHFDFAKHSNEIEINVSRLDSFKDVINQQIPYMVKIDVQGYEGKVINGGLEVIKNAQLVITEVSFSELYDNQALFDDIYSVLKGLGFKYAGNLEQLYSPVNNEILQADTIFINKNKISKP